MEITQKEQDAWHAGIDAGREIERQNATASAEPIHQYRVRYCSDWYDGLPDASDGKDYETRTLFYASPVAQEPVGWQFYQDGKWHNGMETNNHRANTESAGIPTRDVYAAPVAAQAQPDQMPSDVGEAMESARWRNALVGLCDTDRIETPEQAVANVKKRIRRMGFFESPEQQPVNSADVRTASEFRDRLINAIAGLEDCYLSRESIEQAAEDVLHSFTAGQFARPQPSGNAGELPPMPGPGMTSFDYGSAIHWFTETQMQAYARAALADQASAQDREEQPSIYNPITTYGLLIRALRLVADTSLMEMSEGTGYSPAFLSSVEFGREAASDVLLTHTRAFFGSKGIHISHDVLTRAARAAAKERS